MNRNRVAIVVEPAYGDRLWSLLNKGNVWIVQSKTNKEAFDKLLEASSSREKAKTDLTIFSVLNVNDRIGSLIGTLPIVEEHYGELINDCLAVATGFTIEVVGLKADLNVKKRLFVENFQIVSENADGFLASKF